MIFELSGWKPALLAAFLVVIMATVASSNPRTTPAKPAISIVTAVNLSSELNKANDEFASIKLGNALFIDN